MSLIHNQSLAESLAEAVADEVIPVQLSRSLPKDPMLSPMPEETAAMLRESEGDTGLLDSSRTDKSHQPEERDLDAEPTIVPSRLPSAPSTHSQAVPGAFDWMGTLFNKNKNRPKSKHPSSSSSTIEESSRNASSASPKPSSSTSPSPSSSVVLPKPKERKRSAMSIFGTLSGISLITPANPSSRSSSVVVVQSDAEAEVNADEEVRSETASLRSGHGHYHSNAPLSSMSSPIQTSFSPLPAAPLVTTLLDVESIGLGLGPGLTRNNQGSIRSTTSSVHSRQVDQGRAENIEIRQGASLKAISNATRVMTTDARSILVDGGAETGELVKRLAMELVKRAREDGIAYRERRGAVPSIVTQEPEERPAPTHGPVVTLVSASEHANAAVSLSRALAQEGSPSGAAGPGQKKRVASSSFMQVAAGPLFSSFMPQGRNGSTAGGSKSKPDTTNVASVAGTSTGNATPGVSAPNPNAPPKPPPSVPLESIIPDVARPPTQYLSRTYTPVTSREFKFSIPLPRSLVARQSIYQPSLRGPEDATSSESKALHAEPLADRYGFKYDVAQYDVLLLVRATETGCAAPACLTGVKIADREEDNTWPDDDEDEGFSAAKSILTIDVVKGYCPCDGTGIGIGAVGSAEEGGTAAGETQSVKSVSSSKGRVLGRSTPSSTPAGLSHLPPSISSSILSVSADTPRHACANTLRALISRLTDIHNKRQEARVKDWDVFIRRRRARLANAVNSLGSLGGAPGSGSSSGTMRSTLGLNIGLGTADAEDELGHSDGLVGFAQLGLGQGGKEERKEFGRLIRGGIPLIYRPKVWAECCGALDMKEPGLFWELCRGVDEGNKMTLTGVDAEIEKDVGRTMPLNIFFGGDGVGVSKLRRVLVAYSRYVFFKAFLFVSNCSAGEIRLLAIAKG